jgi:hypothetical protein
MVTETLNPKILPTGKLCPEQVLPLFPITHSQRKSGKEGAGCPCLWFVVVLPFAKRRNGAAKQYRWKTKCQVFDKTNNNV